MKEKHLSKMKDKVRKSLSDFGTKCKFRFLCDILSWFLLCCMNLNLLKLCYCTGMCLLMPWHVLLNCIADACSNLKRHDNGISILKQTVAVSNALQKLFNNFFYQLLLKICNSNNQIIILCNLNKVEFQAVLCFFFRQQRNKFSIHCLNLFLRKSCFQDYFQIFYLNFGSNSNSLLEAARKGTLNVLKKRAKKAFQK